MSSWVSTHVVWCIYSIDSTEFSIPCNPVPKRVQDPRLINNNKDTWRGCFLYVYVYESIYKAKHREVIEVRE